MSDSPPSAPLQSGLSAASVLAFVWLALIVATLSFTPMRSSHDEWWHLKTGQWIAEHGLPKNDIFTYTAENIEWHNHEWLSQIALWKIYEWGATKGLGGIRSVIAAKTIYLVLSYLYFAFYLARRSGNGAVSALAVGLAFGLARRTLYFRPPFITYGFLALTLVVLIEARRAKRFPIWLWGLIPFFALWANLHGGFMAGLVIVGAFAFESGVNWLLTFWRSEPKEVKRQAFRQLVLYAAFSSSCFLATLATPYGIHLYALAGRVMSDTSLMKIIFELQPPDWHFVWILDATLLLLMAAVVQPSTRRGIEWNLGVGIAFLLIVRGLPAYTSNETIHALLQVWFRELFAVALLLAAGLRFKERIGLAQTLCAIFFAHQAIQHVRHLPLFGITLAPILAFAMTDWIQDRPTGAWRQTLKVAVAQKPRRVFTFAAQTWLALLLLYYLFIPGESSALMGGWNEREMWANFFKGPSMLNRNIALWKGIEWNPDEYPKKAVDFLIERELPGRIFNGGNYAGYLIWRLAPEKYKLFTYNRYDIYGGQFIRDEHIVMDGFEGNEKEGIPDWRAVLDKWKANTLFIPVKAGVQAVLLEHASDAGNVWKQQYNDGLFAIWVRN